MDQSNTISWLNSELIQRILRKYEKNESIRVVEITQEPVTGDGDNYCSKLIRVKSKFAVDSKDCDDNLSQVKSLIVKIELVNNIRADMFVGLDFFEKETEMLSNILIAMDELCPSNVPFGPKIIDWCSKTPCYIVMEDLKTLGFRMSDRNSGLDLAHSLLAVRKLARFHACSIRMVENNPHIFDKFSKNLFFEGGPEPLREFHESMIKDLGRKILSWSEIDSRYSEKMIKLSESIWERARKASERRKDQFNVLNHGDFWSNNILFRYDEQDKPVDNIFVDFQCPLYSSPMVDYVYFTSVSCTTEVRFEHENEIFEEYHKTLEHVTRQLGCQTTVPSKGTLRNMMTNCVPIAAIGSFAHLPITLTDGNTVNDVDSILEETSDRSELVTWSSAYRNVLPKFISAYEKLGVFDE